MLGIGPLPFVDSPIISHAIVVLLSETGSVMSSIQLLKASNIPASARAGFLRMYASETDVRLIDENGNVIPLGGGGITSVVTDSTLTGEGTGFSPLSVVPANGLVVVDSLEKLPDPSGGVITLEPSTCYWFTTDIDLQGSRLVCQQDTCLIGTSSETSSIKSTGLSGEALITSQFTLPIRHLTITADIALDLDGLGNGMALDWEGVNFLDCPTVGEIRNFANLVYERGALLNSEGMIIGGTFHTVAIGNSIFIGRGGGDIIEVEPGTTVSRRFRVIFSAFVIPSGSIGIDFDPGVTIPTESFILDNVNFSGDGIPLQGLQSQDNECRFFNCVGIENTASVSSMYMTNNSTATVVTQQNVRYNVSGDTNQGSLSQRFTHSNTNNTLRYDGRISRPFKITVTGNMTSSTNNLIGFEVAISRSGNGLSPSTDRIPESEIVITASGARPDAFAVQCLETLHEGDRVYLITRNTSGTANVIVPFFNLAINPAF